MLAEVFTHKTVDDRIDARVRVGEQVKERHDHAQSVMVMVLVPLDRIAVVDSHRRELEKQLGGEERKPADVEQDDDHDEHAHRPFPFRPSAPSVAAVQRRVARGIGAAPQTTGDAPVGAEHGDEGSDVEDCVEKDSVGDLETLVGKVFGADVNYARFLSQTEVEERFDALDGELRRHENQGNGPEGQDKDAGSTDRVQILRLQRMADGVVSVAV